MRLIELTEQQLDETHPMTRMMLSAMGDKNPEGTVKKHKEESKKKRESMLKKLVGRHGGRRLATESYYGRSRYADDDDYGDWKHDEKVDKELDQRWEQEHGRMVPSHKNVPHYQRFENAVEEVMSSMDDPNDPEFEDYVKDAAVTHNVDAYSLGDAVEKLLRRRRGRR